MLNNITSGVIGSELEGSYVSRHYVPWLVRQRSYYPGQDADPVGFIQADIVNRKRDIFKHSENRRKNLRLCVAVDEGSGTTYS